MKEKQALVFKGPRKEKHGFLDQILENCYFDEATGQFYCNKCKNRVYVDWHRNYAFCEVHSNL